MYNVPYSAWFLVKHTHFPKSSFSSYSDEKDVVFDILDEQTEVVANGFETGF